MTRFPVSTSSEQSIYAALELSMNSWLLAIQVPDRFRQPAVSNYLTTDKVVRHSRHVTFQLAEVAVPRDLFRKILRLIDGLRPAPLPP